MHEAPPDPVVTAPDPVAPEPSDPPGAEAAPEADLQRRYEESLAAKTALEERARVAEERADRLDRIIADRLGETAPPANPAADEYGESVAFVEAQLEHMARTGNDNERRWARDQQAQRAWIRNVPEMIQELLGLHGAAPDEQARIKALRGEYAKRGERISIDTAKEILTLRASREQLSSELTKLKAPPAAPPPPGTSMRPSSVPLARDEMTEPEYRRQMATLPDAEREALFRRKQTGTLKIRRG